MNLDAAPDKQIQKKAIGRNSTAIKVGMAVLLSALSGTGLVLLRAQSHPRSGDLVFKSNTSVCGKPISDEVLMIKGGMFRREMHIADGSTFIEIYDCPRQRLIRVHDRTRTYMIRKLAPSQMSQPDNSYEGEAAATLTRTVDIHDTGERRDFFGFTARHIQGTTTDKGGTGKCARDGSKHVWIDGWYIDPPVEGCYWPTVHDKFKQNDPECPDRVTVKVTGLDKLGYSMLDDVGPPPPENKILSIHTETTSVSRAPLDLSLFEPPAEYKEVHTYRQLYGDDIPKIAKDAK